MNIFKSLIERYKKSQGGGPPLWTKDFVILILGSFISLAGSSAIIFALGILILDVSHSNFLYSLTLAISNIAGILVPILAAAFIERTSKRKMIYRLDFLNAILLFCMAILCKTGWMAVPTVFFYCLVFGVINNVYKLSYESYLPKMVSSSLYSKAYSVSSIIITLADAAILLGTFCYNRYGIYSVLLISGTLYLIAACFERKISFEEDLSNINTSAQTMSSYTKDIKKIIEFLKSKRGLLAICVIAFFMNYSLGAFYSVILPFFKFAHHHIRLDGEYIYIIVMSFLSTGEFWGGTINYHLKIKTERRMFYFMLCVVLQFVCMTVFAFTPLPIMMGLMFIAGIANIMAQSMRSTTMYSNVPPELTAKFTGFLQALMCLGYVFGSLTGGGASEFMPIHYTLILTNGVSLLAIVLMILCCGKPLRALFQYKVASPVPDESAPPAVVAQSSDDNN